MLHQKLYITMVVVIVNIIILINVINAGESAFRWLVHEVSRLLVGEGSSLS